MPEKTEHTTPPQSHKPRGNTEIVVILPTVYCENAVIVKFFYL